MEEHPVPRRLLISNLAPGTRDDELIALVKKYAPDLECTDVRFVDAEGSRPAALLSFAHQQLNSLEELSQRLNGMYWKGHSLSASTTLT